MIAKRLITLVSVSLSSAGAWRMGSISVVATGGSTILVISFSAPQAGTDRSSLPSCNHDTSQAKIFGLCLLPFIISVAEPFYRNLLELNECDGLWPDGRIACSGSIS